MPHCLCPRPFIGGDKLQWRGGERPSQRSPPPQADGVQECAGASPGDNGAWHAEGFARQDRGPFTVEARGGVTLPAGETANATQAGSLESSVRLGKGDTIGSALQKLVFGQTPSPMSFLP